MVLHSGKIAEMKTGEGKTLVATLPTYLNALEGKGVHVVTVNDYLARRDSEWMGRLYRFLGMTRRRHPARAERPAAAGRLRRRHHLRHQQRVRLRLPPRQHEVRPRGDGAARAPLRGRRRSRQHPDRRGRTPLIISGPAEESTDLYYEVDRIIPKLKPGAVTRGDTKAEEREELEATGDYIVDEKHKTVTLTESGMAKAEQLLAHRLVREFGRPVRPGEHAAASPRSPGTARAHAVPARRRLHDQGRRRRHRRRVHRPPDAWPPLERRAAPGSRGEGEGQDRAREPDARDHHLPELLPQVQETRRA